MMRSRSTWIARIAVFFILVSLSDDIFANDWPRFRGPDGTGYIDLAWSGDISETARLWHADLPGEGVSSPIVIGERVYVTCADADTGTRSLLCLSLGTGAIDWKKEFPFRSYKKHKNNSFAASTPTADTERVYVLWQDNANSTLFAYTHEGELVWEFDLGPYTHGQGAAASPVVHAGNVFIANDQKQPSFLIAINAASGEERWRIPRRGKRACYASPGILRHDDGGYEVLFSHCYEGVTGVDPQTGETLWRIAPFGTFSQRALISPFVTQQGSIIAGSGAQGGQRIIVALKRNGDTNTKPIQEIHRVTRGASHVPTPVADDQYLYVWGDMGIVTAVNLETGRRQWQHRVGGNFFASPICLGKFLLNIDTDGNLIVLRGGEQPEVVSTLQLGEESRATLAYSKGNLLVRTQSKLMCYRIKGK